MALKAVKPAVTAAWSSSSWIAPQPLPWVSVAQAPDSTSMGCESQ